MVLSIVKLLLLLGPSREIARVRFKTREDELKGFEILLVGGYTITCHDDDIYGVVAEQQLEQLDKAGVIYEKL